MPEPRVKTEPDLGISADGQRTDYLESGNAGAVARQKQDWVQGLE